MKFLLEIGCEEIPASYLIPALESWKKAFEELLKENSISYQDIQVVGTPRRMTVFINKMPEKQEDSEEFVIGPPKDKAFNEDGTPTKALEGFCNKNGITVDQVQEYEEVKKNKTIVRVAATVKHEGKVTADVLKEIIPQTLKKIKFPKYLRWGRTFSDGSIFEFARPVRYFMSMLKDKVLEFDSAGLPIGNVTQTHRFIERDIDFIELKYADIEEYELLLAKNNVMIECSIRKKQITDEVTEICNQLGLKVDENDFNELLPEVSNLVEFPKVIVGEFEEEYLEVPSEILKSAMIKHQRYFPLEDAQGNLQNKFLVVTNRANDDENVIKAGNERVLRARLHDARFFWQNDIETGLEEYATKLDEVSFHQDLGSMKEKVSRVRELSYILADDLKVDSSVATKAAELCKADLVSETVYEFAELQGNIGGLLAKKAGLSEEIAKAIYEHYQPVGRDDEIPETQTGKLISLADKLDSLAGYFLCELDKKKGGDPLGLRRLTLGVIRIARSIPNIDITKFFNYALLRYSNIKLKKKEHEVTDKDRTDALNRLNNYLADRLNVILKDDGKPYDAIEAVIKAGFSNLNLVDTKLDAIIEVAKNENWVSLVRLVERTTNITKNSPDIINFKENLLQDEAEKKLGEAFIANHENVRSLFNQLKFVEGSQLFYDVFLEPTERFFEDVFVNVPDENMRNNRLGLIRSIYKLFADNFARLEYIVISGNDAK